MPSRTFRRVVCLATALALAQLTALPGAVGSASPATRVDDPAPAGVASVTLRVEPTLTVVNVSPAPDLDVPTSLPLGQARLGAAAATDSESVGYVVEVLDAGGAVIHRTTTKVERWIRTEFAAAGPGTGPHAMDHRRTRDLRSVSTVVIPLVGAQQVRVLRADRGKPRASRAVSLPAVSKAAGDVKLVPLPGYSVDNPENRIDIVILGDGYTAAQAGQFAADAKRVADGVLQISPYSDYLDFFNVVAVLGPSNESGADHPPYQSGCTSYPVSCCPDSAAPATGTRVDTRYDSTYCGTGVQRGMVVEDLPSVEADASAVYPAWDQLMVVVNDPEYGGTGGAVATTSVHTAGVLVMQHELGHSLLGLADEYTGAVPGHAACSDSEGSTLSACAANVTDVTDRADLKWRRWVLDSTPIPTSSPQPPDVVGLFKGARYDPDRYYRSCDACIMNFLDTPFGAVAAEQMPVQLYRRGLELVEPRTAIPSPDVPVAAGVDHTFQALVLAPGPGEGSQVRWLVDGEEVATDTVPDGQASLNWSAPDDAAHVVQLEVTDVAGILHPTRRSLSTSTVTWQIGRTGTYGKALRNGGFETALGSGWPTHTTPNSFRKCGVDAHTGRCALRAKLSSKQGWLLAQSVQPTLWPGDRVTLSGAFDSQNLRARVSVVAVVTLKDGSTRRLTLGTLPRDAGDRKGYLKRSASLVLPAAVKKISVRVRLPRGSGTVWVDSLALDLRSG